MPKRLVIELSEKDLKKKGLNKLVKDLLFILFKYIFMEGQRISNKSYPVSPLFKIALFIGKDIFPSSLVLYPER